MQKKRYALIGCGSRSRAYLSVLLEEYNECAEIAALCEPNEGRASDCNDLFESKGARRVPVYHPNDFAALVRNEGPDTVMITSGPDATHAGTGSGKTAAVGRSNR